MKSLNESCELKYTNSILTNDSELDKEEKNKNKMLSFHFFFIFYYLLLRKLHKEVPLNK